MPPKHRWVRQTKDDLAWETNDKIFDDWTNIFLPKSNRPAIQDFILKHRPGTAKKLHIPREGGYNLTWRLEYTDGSFVALRVPQKGNVQFPYEKIRYEVATMRYVAAHTTIPVPRVYAYGTAAEALTGMGPFIIMEWVPHTSTLSEVMKEPGLGEDDHPILDANISDEKLEFIYRQLAKIVLQLSTLEFPRIGSLLEDDEGHISVGARPLIQNMNQVANMATVPPCVLPRTDKTYSTTDEWYSELADIHMMQLAFQHNDAVVDEDDARDKYVARQLFRRLAAEGRLAPGLRAKSGVRSDVDRTFRFWSEDLRPSNILVDGEMRIVAVIDWEFAYSAPSQFTFDPPWWLILREPDEFYMESDYLSWMEAYEPRLKTFLRILEDEERKLGRSGIIRGIQRMSLAGETGPLGKQDAGKSLSQRMRESWETKSWMVNLAARRSWSFDLLFWRHLDPFYFGPNEVEDYNARLGLLSEREIKAMEGFVKKKLEEKAERILVEWSEENALAYRSEVLS